jgi:D-3-phosphoglycerate dehydrogenase
LSRIKIIGRGGVGMDNIDVDYAKSKGITVINTCFIIRISSRISFLHLFSGVRFLHDSNRTMPLEGDSNFDGLKKHMLMESN